MKTLTRKISIIIMAVLATVCMITGATFSVKPVMASTGTFTVSGGELLLREPYNGATGGMRTEYIINVDADADDRLIRVIARDCVERGRTAKSVIDRYQEVLKPMHSLYIEPSKGFADLIVPQGGNNTVAIGLLTEYIEARLRKGQILD